MGTTAFTAAAATTDTQTVPPFGKMFDTAMSLRHRQIMTIKASNTLHPLARPNLVLSNPKMLSHINPMAASGKLMCLMQAMVLCFLTLAPRSM
jgi:hypothetical protein